MTDMNNPTLAQQGPLQSPWVSTPLGTDPEEQLPIPGVVSAAEAILRQPRRVMFQLRNNTSGRLVTAMLIIAVICAVLYGIVVGTFSGNAQLWAAPLKIAAGLVLSGLICLPSLYIFSCLSGSSARFAEVMGFLAGLLALSAVLLIGFAPVAWVFSASTESLAGIGALHLAFWLIATCFGVRFLYTAFAHLKVKSLAGIQVWIIIFILVQLQMMTALRPIVGQADTFLPKEKKFFVAHWIASIEKPHK